MKIETMSAVARRARSLRSLCVAILAASLAGVSVGCSTTPAPYSAPEAPVSDTGEKVPEDLQGSPAGSTARGALLGVDDDEVSPTFDERMDTLADRIMARLAEVMVERVGHGLLLTLATGEPFETGSGTPTAPVQRILRAFAEIVRPVTAGLSAEILVVGHTDALGSDSLNLDLSEQRAKAAARFLERDAEVAIPILVVGRGAKEPLVSNVHSSARPYNRRLEIAIYPKKLDGAPGRRL